MTDLTGAEQSVVNQWIETTLQANKTALNALAANVSDRVFEGLAPFSTPYPFIVYQCQDDPTDVRGVGTVTIMATTQYLVKVLAPKDYIGMGPLVAKLTQILTTSVPVNQLNGGRVLDAVKNKGFHLTETVDGKELRHMGSLLDIHVQGN